MCTHDISSIAHHGETKAGVGDTFDVVPVGGSAAASAPKRAPGFVALWCGGVDVGSC